MKPTLSRADLSGLNGKASVNTLHILWTHVVKKGRKCVYTVAFVDLYKHEAANKVSRITHRPCTLPGPTSRPGVERVAGCHEGWAYISVVVVCDGSEDGYVRIVLIDKFFRVG